MNILPSLGARQITEIEAPEIEAPEIVAMVRLIESRGARDIAKRAMETAGQLFRYAIAHGFAKRNPATEIRPRDILKATHKVNYARIDARELPNLLRQLEIYQGKLLTRLAIKLMALTFVRTLHVVPLSTQALEVLSLLRDLSAGSPWLFPGDRSAQKPMSNNTILKALERKGYKGRMTGHGFRGLASTIRHKQGYPHEHIELQLAHTPRNAVSAAYNHAHHLKARTKPMQDWADFLEQTQRGARVLLFAGVAWIVGLRGRTLSESGSMATSYASPAPVGAYK